jgi:homogentisate 1,2-dioxygenase
MIDYRKLGAISEKPHTIFEVDGKMVAEYVFTRDGFSDLYSILYLKRAPTHETNVKSIELQNPFFPVRNTGSPQASQLLRRHVKTSLIPQGKDFLESRTTLYFNDDCSVGIAKFSETSSSFFSNGDSDEMYFVAEGSGTLQTIFGEIDYGPSDYLYIPKSVPFRFLPKGPQYLMAIEGRKSFGIPKEFRVPQGQLRMDAPYTHRDFRGPERLLSLKPTENFPIIIMRGGFLSSHEYTEWPYQCVGWDGWVYPFAFNVNAYQPKTSNIHLPPTVHAAFSGQNFYIMNFVPRIVDYHPKAVPCPYPHHNVDCDELLFYVHGEFTSRKNISQYSMSFHPGGVPHGPHPEKYEASVGARETNELAIMVDTFAPLRSTEAAMKYEDKDYHYSWNSKEHL